MKKNHNLSWRYQWNKNYRDIIKSKGDKVENLRIEVTADLPKQLGTIAAEKSPEELTAAIQALLEQNEDYKKLKPFPVLVWNTVTRKEIALN